MTTLDATQLSFMDEEFCILVDESDNACGFASKRDCHLNSRIFVTDGSAPLLHRAFSVLLFDESNQLLLQRRADDKITFGGHWTNTCCSHPLHGRTPDESDGARGACIAAVRKLEHELGIAPSDALLAALRPVTRVRYAARSDATWGENEVDYILLLRVRRADAPLALNANEVSHTQWVTRDRMRDLLTDGTTLTPWFRLLCEHFLFAWWDELERQDGKLDIDFTFDPVVHSFFDGKSAE
jgi:isopentenyl-diphosphate delta-isomerase